MRAGFVVAVVVVEEEGEAQCSSQRAGQTSTPSS